MPRKPLSCRTHRRLLRTPIALLLAVVPSLFAAEASPPSPAPHFLGAAACSTSGCHGGGGHQQNQFFIWSLQDAHSQRAPATLTTARSRQIAAALGVKDATTDPQCIACHAPLHTVPVAQRGKDFKTSEGISCESCHAPAENWLRSHTRPDWTPADRAHAGMRDLKNLYVRANTCASCHQTVATPLLRAGHPELIFELDGQAAAQPRHWREPTNAIGARAWFIGQAVALREMSWQLAQAPEADDQLAARWAALLWLLQKLDRVHPEFPSLAPIPTAPTAANARAAHQATDDLAKRAAALPWTVAMSRAALERLAATAAEFQSPAPAPLPARRAERLVLALDRLLITHRTGTNATPADTALNRLFALAQSIPDFQPPVFGEALRQFGQATAALPAPSSK